MQLLFNDKLDFCFYSNVVVSFCTETWAVHHLYIYVCDRTEASFVAFPFECVLTGNFPSEPMEAANATLETCLHNKMDYIPRKGTWLRCF